MNKKEIIETVIGSTNVFLMEHAKNFEDAVMYCSEKDEETLSIYSGEKAIFEGSIEECAEKIDELSELVKGSVKSEKKGAKNAKSGANVSAKSEKGAKERMRSEIDFVTEKVARSLEDANRKLAKITSSGFPYSYDEVEIRLEHDSLGMYVHSGRICVSAVMRAGNPYSVANVLIEKIRDVVDSTRAAVERRASLRDEAHALQAEGEKTRGSRRRCRRPAWTPRRFSARGLTRNRARRFARRSKRPSRRRTVRHSLALSRTRTGS